jgi:3-hydroxyacyl-CoA dehydrogenase/enoyl-CoA hydratase/3-hydroxybutyryl-CoA epimerase
MRAGDFVTIEKTNGVATLWLDHRNETQNIVSPEVVEVLRAILADIEIDPEVKACVFISRKENFIAGADIKAFAIDRPGQFRPIQAAGHEALSRLERSTKPSVAAVHGACLGLGTELALACQARIATDDPSTRFALPEIRLGLLPGGGGTQRLPRRVGIRRALDLMLSGKNVYANQALGMGLVDDVVNPQKLHRAAVLVASRLAAGERPRRPPLPLLDRMLESTPVTRRLLFRLARRRALAESKGRYPAVPAILDCVETGALSGQTAGFARELDLFEPLLLSPESRALRTLFFATTEHKTPPKAERVRSVRTVGVVGAGFMGAGIAEVSLMQGLSVLLRDLDAAPLAKARRAIWTELEKRVRQRSLLRTQAEETFSRLRGQQSFEGFAHVDVAIEAVVEQMDVKHRVVAELEANGREDLIVATNTSSLSVAELASVSRRPERVIGMHYFSPVPKMPLLEIVRTDRTADDVLATCFALGVRQGKTCIVVRDSPGFFVNRILAPYMNEALLLVDEGVGIDAVDRAMEQLGFPVGPLRLFDEVGFDIAAHVSRSCEVVFRDRPGFVSSGAVGAMFGAGRLGRKNAQGFYLYDGKTGRRRGVDPSAYTFFARVGHRDIAPVDIQERLFLLMINEAVLCLEEGIIATPTDGDLGAVFGIGFPAYTGGPFRYVDQAGAAEVVRRLDSCVGKHGLRFTPAGRLRELAGAGARFHSA